MARMARKNLDGKYFHIMVQGIAQENIFLNDNAKGYYLSCLQKFKSKKPVGIFAFCVMDNHAHLLLSAENVAVIAAYMKIVNSEYARYYNNENNRIGYVFRDRFKSEVIQDEKYLLSCLAYIHNNPAKAGIVKKSEDYRFSSYTNYLTKRGIVDFDEAKKYYDITPSNIKAIMKERSHSDWLKHDDNVEEDEEKVLDELVIKYGLSKAKLEEDDEKLVAAARELKVRCGLSIRKVANILAVNRERLRKLMSIPPSL
ncbi:MAG: transposase [Endomicrobia bacterium]|nr:transposase [Endomicrobiia bacterium]